MRNKITDFEMALELLGSDIKENEIMAYGVALPKPKNPDVIDKGKDFFKTLNGFICFCREYSESKVLVVFDTVEHCEELKKLIRDKEGNHIGDDFYIVPCKLKINKDNQ